MQTLSAVYNFEKLQNEKKGKIIRGNSPLNFRTICETISIDKDAV